jgi:hypothetical protein
LVEGLRNDILASAPAVAAARIYDLAGLYTATPRAPAALLAVWVRT